MAEGPEKDEKTESATPRRRQEAREKGQVALSGELVTTLLLVGWILMFLFAGAQVSSVAGSAITNVLGELPHLGTRDVDLPELAGWLTRAAIPPVKIIAIVAGIAVALAFALSYGQIGFEISPKALALDWARVNPAKGFSRLLSARSFVRTGMALAKILVVLTTVTVVAWMHVDEVIRLSGSELGPILAGTAYVAFRCVLAAFAVLVALSVADFAFQRWQHERDMRMTKKEVREEHKSTEGDPHLKARIRRVQREMASRRMMADVPDATVVVTNPTHFAVALKYDRDDEDNGPVAPRVVAKGVDEVAQRIKEVAREAGIICYEDVQLARTLHARVEIGDEIPVDLYTAVAEVLAYVFRIKGVGAGA